MHHAQATRTNGAAMSLQQQQQQHILPARSKVEQGDVGWPLKKSIGPLEEH